MGLRSGSTIGTGLLTLVLFALSGTAPGQSPDPAKASATAPSPGPAPATQATTKEKGVRAAAGTRDAEITVKSREAARRTASRSTAGFLTRPGSDRYDSDGEDWRDVPPWRQASFFGVRARGQFFLYVVDCSGSMGDDSRLVRAKGELRRSVLNLQPPQRFQVIFYNDRPVPLPGGLPRPADLASKSQFNDWLRLIEPDGGTDPRGALATALSLRPDAIFLLSDGLFPDGTVEAAAARNPHRIPIHCVDLSGGLAGDQLARIARDSGGRYVPRPPRADELSP